MLSNVKYQPLDHRKGFKAFFCRVHISDRVSILRFVFLQDSQILNKIGFSLKIFVGEEW